MTDEEKAIATRVAEGAFPIFLAREVNAVEGGKYASDDGKYAASNAWTVAEMFIQARRQYLGEQDKKDNAFTDPNILSDQERILISAGQKIQAIKEIRNRTGTSLAEAKGAADRYQDTIGMGSANPNEEVPF